MEALLNQLIRLLVQVGPWIVFATTFVETAFFVGLLIPAEAVVLLGGALAATGEFALSHVIAATFFGALLGDQAGFMLGKFGGNRVVASDGYIAHIWKYYEPFAARLFRKHAAVSVSIARFISFVRTLMPWFAGMSGMPYARYLAYDILGVLGWSLASVAVGYAAGESWRVVAERLGTATAYILGGIVVIFMLTAVRRKIKARAMAKQARLRVALTGNIASGKSLVVNVWRELGAHVIDADILAREAIAAGSAGYERVVHEFGNDIVRGGDIDRARLRAIVFDDPEKRELLESIVHPEVKRMREEEEKKLFSQGVRIVVSDIPLLYEAGLENNFDVVVLVDAPEDLRIKRIVENRGLTEDEARKMVAAQMPSSQKRLPGTYVIDNDGTIEELREKATQIWRDLEERVK